MALAEGKFVKDMPAQTREGDVVLGDDWVAPDSAAPDEMRARRESRGLFSLRASPLTRKIITFNLIALNVLVAGILYLNSARDSLAVQRAASLVSEAELIADVFEAQLPFVGGAGGQGAQQLDVPGTLRNLDLRSGIEVFVYDTQENLVGSSKGSIPVAVGDAAENADRTLLTDGRTARTRTGGRSLRS